MNPMLAHRVFFIYNLQIRKINGFADYGFER